MEIRIWSRRPEEKGGYIMMPMKKNVPEGRIGWKLVKCSECGRECWERPKMEQLAKEQGAAALCTECALRKGMGLQGN